MQLLITGMHRSGTSVIARLLNESGCDLGRPEDLMPAKPDNPDGFWEHLTANEINIAILDAAGVTWDTALGDELGHLSQTDRTRFSSSILQFVGEMSADREIWGIKDPRLALTLPLWRQLLTQPVVVWCVRDPVEIGLSIEGRNGFPVHLGVALWEAYTIAAMNAIETTPVVVASYASLLEDPASEVTRIVTCINRISNKDLCPPPERLIGDIVKPHLHRAVQSDGMRDSFVTPHYQRLWERAMTAEGWEDSAGSTRQLSRLSRDLILLHRQQVRGENPPITFSAAVFHETLAGIEGRAANRWNGIEARIDTVGQRCDRVLDSLDTLDQRLVASLEDRDSLQKALDHQEVKLGQLRAELAEAGDQLVAAAETRVRLERTIEQKALEAEACRNRLKQLETTLSTRDQERIKQNSEIESCARTLRSLESIAEARAREIEDKNRELRYVRSELTRHQSILTELRSSRLGRLQHWWWRRHRD